MHTDWQLSNPLRPVFHEGEDMVQPRAVSRLQRAGVRSIFSGWRRARWTACLIAMMVLVRLHPAQSQEAKPAEPNVAAANRAVQSQLPFSDRQDFEDAMRGFIA